MATPFATRRSRRVGVFIGFWIVCIGSIIANATSDGSSDIVGYVLVLGRFYAQAHASLVEFASIATVPTWVPLFSYLVLAAAVVLVSLFVLEIYTLSETYYFLMDTYVTVVVYGTILVVLLTAFLSLLALTAETSAFFVWLGVTIRFTLGLGPQALVFSVLLLAISLVTAYVP